MKLNVGIVWLLSVLFLPVQSAFAQSLTIEAVPTAWRLQNIVSQSPNYIDTYFSGSGCTNGRLLMGASADADSRNRYWALIMSAKIAGKKVRVYYDKVGDQCTITSFLLSEE